MRRAIGGRLGLPGLADPNKPDRTSSESSSVPRTYYHVARTRTGLALPPPARRQGGFLLDRNPSTSKKELVVQELTGAQALVRSLEQQGVEVVCGLPRRTSMP